jgi:hypothetical protein
MSCNLRRSPESLVERSGDATPGRPLGFRLLIFDLIHELFLIKRRSYYTAIANADLRVLRSTFER